jgi:hypothetical protein
MYVVIHGDTARGEAIVQALGGEAKARLVPRAGGAIRLAMDGVKLDGILASPDVVDTVFSMGDFREEQALRGVPVIFDGGKTGALYRAFARAWTGRRTFRHLRGATPEQAAAALRTLEPQPEPPPLHRRVGWWVSLVLLVIAMAGMGYDLVRPGVLPRGVMSAFLFLCLLGSPSGNVATPVWPGLRRGIRPSFGAVVWSLVLAGVAGLFVWALVSAWRGT